MKNGKPVFAKEAKISEEEPDQKAPAKEWTPGEIEAAKVEKQALKEEK